MKYYGTIGVLLMSCVLLSGCGAAPPTDSEGALVGAGSQAVNTVAQDLATAKAATARYHDVNTAIADGYVLAGECVQTPEGSLGYIYANYALVADPAIDLSHPELLHYGPKGGALHLAGVEYLQFIFENGQPVIVGPPALEHTPPVLFGQAFEGPVAGHRPGMPWHFELPVWLWRHNPDGLFAEANRSFTCP